MLTARSTGSLIAAGLGLSLFTAGCSSAVSSDTQSAVSLMAEKCVQSLSVTVGLPLPTEYSDTNGIYSYATAVGECMQRMYAGANVYCQTTEGSDGVPRRWCGIGTGQETIDLTSFVKTKVPVA